jgi:hypothetical protein
MIKSRGGLLFGGLVLADIGLMLVSWFTPWWVCTVDAIYMLHQGLVMIRPWGLEHTLGNFAGYLAEANLPFWFAWFMWAYLVVSIVVALVALFLKDRKIRLLDMNFNLPQLLIALVGVAYIVCAITAAVFARFRTSDFGVNFMGYSNVVVDPHSGGYADLNASLQWGYWLAYAVGLLFIVLAFLRNKITGTKAA